ncbi:unnamed protein product [Rotaria sp. Silwood2]|nr:unnamed protein product [Rotaria sp. Silwood2]
MPAKKKSFLATLPVELVHRIFDHLKTETILFSIRYVCKRFYSITNTYNGFDLDFRYMSRSDLPFIARIIDPKNVISLTLSDEIQTPGQIRSFLNHFHIERFIRLRSLNLVKVECKELDTFQKHISKCRLTTLSIAPNVYYKDGPTALISSIISNNDLRKFEYTGFCNIFNKIQLPIQCGLEHLTISHSNWDSVYSIIFHLPYLQTLAVKNVIWNQFNSITFTYSDIPQPSHLTSLSLNFNYDMPINDVESVLSCLPMLMHLRLISERPLDDLQLFNGFRWENFIQTKLPLLNRFEFWFTCLVPTDSNCTTVESLIVSFQTSFWLEIKQWIIKCDYEYKKYHSKFHLYSIPIVRDNFDYYEQETTILHSALNTTDNHATIIVNARQLSLNLSQMMTNSISHLVSDILYF